MRLSEGREVLGRPLVGLAWSSLLTPLKAHRAGLGGAAACAHLLPDLPMYQVLLHLESLKGRLLHGALQQRARPLRGPAGKTKSASKTP